MKFKFKYTPPNSYGILGFLFWLVFAVGYIVNIWNVCHLVGASSATVTNIFQVLGVLNLWLGGVMGIGSLF